MDSRIESELQNSRISKLLVKYSGPAIIECVAVSLYNIIDSVFVGHEVGPMALAALAIALPLMNLIVGFCTLISTGGAAMISIFLGRKQNNDATSTVNIVMLLCLVHALLFGGLMYYYLDPILKIFGATEATVGLAHSYMRIILLGTPISYIFLGLNNMMRASGYPTKAMVSALLSVVINIILCFVLMTHMKLGVEGAAWATVGGQTAALIWCIYHFCSRDSLVRFNFRLPWFNKMIAGKIYAIGMAPFLMNCCACIVVVFLNHALLRFGGAEGNYDIGAYGIINRVTMVFIMVVNGLTLGMQPIIGFNYGAGQWSRVKKTLRYGIYGGVIITSIGWILTQCFPEQLCHIFTYSKELIDIDRSGFRIYFICYPVVGAQIVIQNFFQFIDKPKYSIALSMTRQMIFLLPFLIFLPKLLGVPGVWWSMAASDMLALMVAVVLLVIVLRKVNKTAATNQQAGGAVKA